MSLKDETTLTRSSYPAKGGNTKTDGQNIKNLRRPTLVLDRMFPNSARADHEIVYVDETAKVAYSIGRDRKFRKATWTSITDMASTWGVVKSKSPDTVVWAAAGVFFKESVTGNLFMYQSNQSTGQDDLLRSTDDGSTWASVLTMPGPNRKRCLGPQSVVQDPVTKYLYLVEYTTVVEDTTADIWRSTDNGATWAVWKSMPRDNAATNTIRHWHSARWDSVSQRVHFMAGDQNDIAGIYRVNAAGTDIEPVILNKHVPYNTFPGVGYAARAVDVMFFPNYIVWANDGGGGTVGQNYVYRMNRNQIGATNPVVEQIAAIDNTGWYTQQASSDGTTWVFSTSTEIGGGPNPDPYTTHLYAVTNDGANVDEITAVVMDGNEVGTASLTGFGNGGGAGQAFWLRAHNFAPGPTSRNTFSAFQLRARIAYGVTQLIKPSGDRLLYRNESRNWWGSVTGTDPASVPVEFGHCTVSERTTKLVIRNYGVKTNAGTANTIQLQVYNATTGLIMLSTATIRDDRYTRDTDEYSTTLNCAAGDQIVFRVVETTNTAVTASGMAFVEFGFALP
jgi:hypothetical protein